MAVILWGTGRRKSAVARVRLASGSGRIFVNDREASEYFPLKKFVRFITAPLQAVKGENSFDIFVAVSGGGMNGQAGAVRLGIARALARADPAFESALRDGKYMTRDSRVKERKKYGRRGARRGFQFSKR